MNTVKVGILSTGHIAGVMAATLKRMEGVSLWAVGSRDLEKARAFGEQFQAKKAYGSYEELAADRELDLIYVASPHSLHREHTLLCLKEGKNVLCEKAFARNASEAREMISLAKSRGLLLAEAMWPRYTPLCKKLRELLSSGAVGSVSGSMCNLHYKIDRVPRIFDPNLAGGALLDVGVYPINFSAAVHGDGVQKVFAHSVLLPTGVDGETGITLLYKDGSLSQLSCGVHGVSDRRGGVWGDKGFIEVDNINNFESIRIYDAQRKLTNVYTDKKQLSGYEYEVLSCKKAIEEGRTETEEMPLGETLRIMELLDEIRRQIGVSYPNEEGAL